MEQLTSFIFKIIKKAMYGAMLCSVFVCSAQAATTEELQDRVAKIRANIEKTTLQQQEVEANLNQLNQNYKKEMSSVKVEGLAAYDAKIAEAKKQKAEQKTITKQNAAKPEVKAEAQTGKTAKKQETSTPKKQEKASKVSYPKERNPRYVAPKNNNKGRRPFTRSDNEYHPDKIYFAQRKGSAQLSFAKEEAQGYTGTTEENVFVFSDNLANYCEMDTNSLDKMSDCLNKLIKERAQGSQTLQQQVNELYQESLIDTTAHAIADASRYKNDSSGYEKNVLIPLQEKSSKSTDERGDIEVYTLTEMEALKLKHRLIQIRANQLGFDAFKDFGTYEVNDREMTNIDVD